MAAIAPVRQAQLVQRSVHEIEVRLVVGRDLTGDEEERLQNVILEYLGHPFTLRFTYVDDGFMLRETIKHPQEYLIPHVLAPEDFSTGIATWYNTVCSMCAAGCGIAVRTREGRAKKIEGNPAHPVSQGRLCSLGQSGLQVLYNPDRLTAP